MPYCRSEQGLELDLFMMQCCAALAPPDLYVRRIIERFGLSDYLHLNQARGSEYVHVFWEVEIYVSHDAIFPFARKLMLFHI